MRLIPRVSRGATASTSVFFLIFLTRATDFAEKEGFLVVYDIIFLGKYFKVYLPPVERVEKSSDYR